MIKHPYYTDYSVSENGSVFNKDGYELKPIDLPSGYCGYTMRKFGKQRQVRAHRFVWQALVGDIPDDMCINHKNGNKKDNRLSNLECVTYSQNTQHSFDVLGREGRSGMEHHNAKITEEDVLFIRSSNLSNKDIGLMFGLHPNYVWLVRNNKRWNKI